MWEWKINTKGKKKLKEVKAYKKNDTEHQSLQTLKKY